MAFGILERGTLCCPFVFVRVSSSFEKHCGTIHTLLLRKFVLLSHHGQRPPILAQPFIHHFVQLVQRSLARSRTSPRLLKLVGVLLGARLGCSLGGSLGASLVCPTQHTTPHTPIIHTPEHPRTPPHTAAHPRAPGTCALATTYSSRMYRCSRVFLPTNPCDHGRASSTSSPCCWQSKRILQSHSRNNTRRSINTSSTCIRYAGTTSTPWRSTPPLL